MRPRSPKLAHQLNERLQLQGAQAAAQPYQRTPRTRPRAHFAERYQWLIANCFRLQAVRTKQQLVAELLPYYPHALTPAQQAAVALR